MTTLPECYDLPAILAVTVQVANIGPLSYVVTKYCLQRFSVKVITIETVAVFVLVVVGLVTCVLLSFLWDMTAVVAGEVHSAALVVLAFGLSLVDCTSTLVFIPFMKHFPAQYISALYIGEGMSGVLPSIVALSQGFVNESLVCVGDYTGIEALGINFSPNIYFAFLSSLTLLCGLAFLGIVSLPTVRKQLLPSARILSTCSPWRASAASSFKESSYVEDKLPSPLETSDDGIVEPDDKEYTRFNNHHESKSSDGQTSPLISSNSRASSTQRAEQCLRSACGTSSHLRKVAMVAWNVCSLLVCMMLVNFITNGAIPAISAFIFKPYGNTVYHIAVNLGILAYPLAVLVYVFVPCKSKVLVTVLTAISSLLSIYMLIVAILSPDPPLKDHIVGDLIIVSAFNSKGRDGGGGGVKGRGIILIRYFSHACIIPQKSYFFKQILECCCISELNIECAVCHVTRMICLMVCSIP